MATAHSTMRSDIAKKVRGYISGTTTSAGAADGSTFVCTSLKEYSDGYLQNRWALIGGVKRKIDTNFKDTGTVRLLIPYAAQVANSTAFEIYSIDPDDITAEINKQLADVFPILCQVVVDETTETVAGTYTYDKPEDESDNQIIEGDPYQIELEGSVTTEPWAKLLDWDYDPVNETITFGYYLAGGYNVRMIGINTLSLVEDDADETELDEPEVQLIYAKVVKELYRQLSAGELGTDGDKYRAQVKDWEKEAERLEAKYAMKLPTRTMKIRGWRP